MLPRYATQRDLDGSWSVRDTTTGQIAIVRGMPVVGLTEGMAAMRARKLNAEDPHRSEKAIEQTKPFE
jgi:hypothetical protein